MCIRDSCKYHIVFAPKFRRKEIYGELKKEVGKILRQLCEWKGVTIIEAYTLSLIHIQMCIRDRNIVDRSENFISLKKNEKIEYVKQATKTSKDTYVSVLIMENKTVTKKVLAEKMCIRDSI